MDSKIDSLIAGAPNALNTLKELSTAINDDSNFAGTVTTALSNRYTKEETDTSLNAKLNTSDDIPMSQVTNLETTLLNFSQDLLTKLTQQSLFPTVKSQIYDRR